MTENSKLSVDSAFSFGAVEANRKHRIDINSRKNNSAQKQKNVFRVTHFTTKTRYEIV